MIGQPGLGESSGVPPLVVHRSVGSQVNLPPQGHRLYVPRSVDEIVLKRLKLC